MTCEQCVRLTGQVEDLPPGSAVVLRRGDDALGPQAPGAQLVHADARGQRVVAGSDPVVGCRGHDEADPSGAAGRGADNLPAHERHGAAARLLRTQVGDVLEAAVFEIIVSTLLNLLFRAEFGQNRDFKRRFFFKFVPAAQFQPLWKS